MKNHAKLGAVWCPVARAAALCALLISPSAWALDASQAKVVWGMATVQTSGSTTTVSQRTGAVRIDWSNMDVPAGNTLAFNQIDASSVAINVVTGNAATNILGSVTAPGHVYVLNPNGVLIGRGAQVNVGSFVASTMVLDSFDLDSGALVLKRGTPVDGAQVKNDGAITADGGSVALVGNQVSNSGSISAAGGRVMLLGGDRVVLTPDRNGLLSYSLDRASLVASVSNTGRISAAGGQIALDARSLAQAVVNSSGIVEAAGVSEGPDGVIRLMALGAAGSKVSVRGTVDAGASGLVTADLAEGGQLDFGPELLRAHAPAQASALNVSALDKVYDGTTDATVRIDLSSMPGSTAAPVTLDIVQAHFDDRFVQVDGEPGYVWFTARLSGETALALPGSLAARISPREIHLEADTKTYDGRTDATVHVPAGDVLDIDKDILRVSVTGAQFAQANVSPDGLVPVTWSGQRLVGAAAASYKLSDSASGRITPKLLSVNASDKVADGSTAASVSLVTSGIVASDLEQLSVTLSNAAFDSAAPSAAPVGVSYAYQLVGAASGNYALSGRTSALITAPVTPPVPVTPVTIPDGLPGVIDNGRRGGQSSAQNINPGALSDLLSNLPPPAAGNEDEDKKTGTSRSDINSPIRVIDGGVKLPALLTVR
jgi:filamentous hemagglutinin family protein